MLRPQALVTRSGGLPLMLALVLGAVTFAGTLAWLRTRETIVEVVRPTLTSVVVARTEVPAGSVLTEAMLTLTGVNPEAVGDHALHSNDAAIGRVLRYPLARGEQVLESKLVSADTAKSGLAFAIPRGMRAVSVPVSEVTAAGGLIAPGDRVDLLVSAPYERLLSPLDPTPPGVAGQRGGVVTVLQDALVLAVGQSVTTPIAAGRDVAAQRVDDAKPQPKAVSVTVAASPKEAELLLMASSAGSIGVTLRPFGDRSTEPLAPTLKLAPAPSAPRGQ